jgi:hypothetical protein
LRHAIGVSVADALGAGFHAHETPENGLASMTAAAQARKMKSPRMP